MAKRKRSSGKQTVIVGEADMKWLREVHVPRLPRRYKFAVIYGNEDCPTRIDLYKRVAPTISDRPRVLRARGCTFKFKKGSR